MDHGRVSLLNQARGMLDQLIELRRTLHRRPEVGLTLPGTQRAVLDALAGLDLDVRLGNRLSSIVAVLEGHAAGPMVLLRADMDALPIQEATGLDFASEVGGVMHACGHDAHTAMRVGGARILARRRGEMIGRVVFAFQPGEEGYAGARLMIEECLLDAGGAPPDAASGVRGVMQICMIRVSVREMARVRSPRAAHRGAGPSRPW